MEKIDYNIIIPVVFKDYSFIRKTLKYVCWNLDAKKIFIITDRRMINYLPKEILKNNHCVIIDENSLLDGLTFEKIRSIIISQGRRHTNTGWFFQQFLKMAFALSNHCDTEYYLTWDADTIPLHKISFFDDMNHPYFTMKTEYHRPYFDAIYRLIGIDKVNPRSFIAEHMMFSKTIMSELISTINSSYVLGDVWYEKIMNSIVPETVSTDSFSEFETYGSYCMVNYPDLYRERHIPGFRKGALIQGRFVTDDILKRLSDDVYIASFEIYDRPPFPWNLMCDINEWYRKKKELWIRRRIKS